MTTTIHRIALQGGAAGETAAFAVVAAPFMSRDCTLRCEVRGQRLEATAGNYFAALCALRETLEAQGLIPVCWGASRNVYPSGMALDMGQGLSAYRTVIGEPARITDLVEIFATDPEVQPATVREQREFHERWLAST
jgi:hypothetical protein